MVQNTPYSGLLAAIKNLEGKQAEQKQELKEQFKIAYESLTPLNILKKAIGTFAGSPEVHSTLLGVLIPLATGFIGKKAFAGNRRPSFINRFGILFIDGINRYVSQNPEVINSISHFILNFFHKKKNADQQPE